MSVDPDTLARVDDAALWCPVPDAPSEPGPLEAHLRAQRSDGRKLLVPYVTGGISEDWPAIVEAVAAAGADAIEIGIPFSDPVMDGPTIQAASEKALRGGATPPDVIARLADVDVDVPLAVMTYYNPIVRIGVARFAGLLAAAGVAAAIVPDVPLEESGAWCAAADSAGVETVMLAAPTADDARLERIVTRARGFVYGVGLLGVTGERAELASSATDIARRLKAVTDRPVLVGVGVSTPSQAAQASEVADGVIVGSALIRRLLDGGGPDGAHDFVAELRAGLDAA